MILTKEDLGKMSAAYKKDATQHVIEAAVTKNGVLQSAERGDVIAKNSFVFSIDVDSEAVANQAQSGRCWMFACLNTLRLHMKKALELKHGTFQLSQNYTFFYDKLEKANFFLQEIVDSGTEPLSDRKVSFLLNMPQQDGGDWDIITAIIKKYGVVPREAMPETACSIDSADLNTVLNRLLRQDALELRSLVRKEASEKELDEARVRMLSEVYRILGVCLGTPPEHVDFEYRDKNGKYASFFHLTPKEFYEKFVPIDLDDYVGVINVPIDSMPFNRLYGIELSNEIIAGRPNRYLNVDMDTLKAAAIAQLKAGEPVWFGCDVMQCSDIQKGIMDTELYDLAAMFGVDFTMDKGQRFAAHESLPTHAMVIGGVDLVDDKPIRWKVENSWGTENKGKKVGHDGYFVMSDAWMDQYTYEVAVRKDLLPAALQKELEADPIILPYWSTFNPVLATDQK